MIHAPRAAWAATSSPICSGFVQRGVENSAGGAGKGQNRQAHVERRQTLLLNAQVERRRRGREMSQVQGQTGGANQAHEPGIQPRPGRRSRREHRHEDQRERQHHPGQRRRIEHAIGHLQRQSQADGRHGACRRQPAPALDAVGSVEARAGRGSAPRHSHTRCGAAARRAGHRRLLDRVSRPWVDLQEIARRAELGDGR